MIPMVLLAGCQFQSLTADPQLPAVASPPDGCSTPPRTPTGPQYDIGDLHAVITSTVDGFASEVGIPGDLNGDGCDDLVTNSGELLTVFFGPLGPGVWTADEADVTFAREGGLGVHRAGDVDHDGREDFWSGTTVLGYDGAALQVIASFPLTSGYSVGGFDADSDGEIDAFVGGNSYGSVLLVYGPLAAWGISDAYPGVSPQPADAATVVGPCGNDSFGHAQWLGDLDGDAVGDFLMGVCIQEGLIFAGGDRRGTLVDASDAWLAMPDGHFAKTASDLDGDGLGDILDHAGVWSGASLDTGNPIRVMISGDRTLSALGGDVDADGHADLLVSMDGNSDEWVVSGTVSDVASSAIADLGPPISDDAGPNHPPASISEHSHASDSAGDITGDGGVDLLDADAGSRAIYIWGSEGLSLSSAPEALRVPATQPLMLRGRLTADPGDDGTPFTLAGDLGKHLDPGPRSQIVNTLGLKSLARPGVGA